MVKLILVLLTSLSSALAADVFSFITPPCQIVSGVPLDMTEEGLVILTTEGKLKMVVPENLSGLAHYVVPRSPYQSVHYPQESAAFQKHMVIKESDRPLVGFPYYFTEEVIFVLDQYGRRIVIGEDELGRTTLQGKLLDKKATEKVPITLALPAGLGECKQANRGILPVRLSTDKVQILELVSSWEQGFKKINDLVERTDFYPRPHMFQGENRIGFFAMETPDETESVLPLRVRIVNGEDFGFQGETFFGGGLERTGPRALPMTLLSTELKFHFLHALFVGNVEGMAMGASYYSKGNDYVDRTEKEPRKASSDTSFNHFALIGGDWKSFGLHVGPVFPIFFIQNGDAAREVRPRKAMPMARVSWTGEKVKGQLSFSKGEVEIDSNVGKRASVMSTGMEDGASVDSFRMNFQFYRLGVSWGPFPEWEWGMDWLHWDWDYKDSLNGDVLNFDSSRDGLLFSVRKDFGEYVSLSFNYLMEMRKEKGSGANGKFDNDENVKSLGGALEFLF